MTENSSFWGKFKVRYWDLALSDWGSVSTGGVIDSLALSLLFLPRHQFLPGSFCWRLVKTTLPSLTGIQFQQITRHFRFFFHHFRQFLPAVDSAWKIGALRWFQHVCCCCFTFFADSNGWGGCRDSQQRLWPVTHVQLLIPQTDRPGPWLQFINVNDCLL